MRLWVAEIDQHAVAHVFGNKPVERGDSFADRAVIGGDYLAQVFGVEPCREFGRADQIAEHHRQLPALGFGSHRGIGGRGGWDLGAECGNRGEQSAPVPDEGDAEVPQVVGGQLRQHRGVDRVVAKPRFVLLQAETVEPGCDVHPRLPAAVTCRAALTLQEDYRSRARNERGWSPSSHAPIAAFVDWLVAEAAVIGL